MNQEVALQIPVEQLRFGWSSQGVLEYDQVRTFAWSHRTCSQFCFARMHQYNSFDGITLKVDSRITLHISRIP